MRQVRFFASVILMTGVILLGFQNCGQPGAMTAASSTSASSLSNSLEISLPNSEVAPGGGSATVKESEDPNNTINDQASEAICRDVKASDVLLNVSRVIGDGASFDVSQDPSISIEQASLDLEAVTSGDVKELSVVLKDEGNVLMGINGMVYDLSSPGGQALGLKVVLAAKTHVEAGHRYELKLNIDLSQQIVRAGKKCLIKPAIQAASLKQI